MLSFKSLRSINFTNILFMTTFFYSENPLNYHIYCCDIGSWNKIQNKIQFREKTRQNSTCQTKVETGE